VGALRYRLLDLLPVARAALIEGMEDGVIVLDAQDRVLDFNQAARPIVDQPWPKAIGQPAERVLIGWPAVAERHRGREGVCSELALAGEASPRYYDLRSSPLFGHAGELNGTAAPTRHACSCGCKRRMRCPWCPPMCAFWAT
jgi:PAS domain-containing protein